MDAHHGEPDRPWGVSDGGEKVDVVGTHELALLHEVDHGHQVVEDTVRQGLSKARWHR